MEKKIIEITDDSEKKALLYVREGINNIIVKNELYDKKEAEKYKNIKIGFGKLNNQNVLILQLEQDDFSIEIINTINNHPKDKIWNILNRLKHLFETKKNDYLKFRGDLAEIMFIYKIGGKKLHDSLSADIQLNNHLIEIKSCSLQRKIITINNQQLQENTLKYVVCLELDQNGLTILDIARKAKENSTFKIYLNTMYKNSFYGELKYKIVSPINITEQLPKIKLPSNVKSAQFEIFINTNS